MSPPDCGTTPAPPPGRAPGSLARKATFVMYSAGGLGLLLAAGTAFFKYLYDLSPWSSPVGETLGPVLAVFTAVAFAVALGACLVRLATSVLLESQLRLVELLVSLFAVGLVASLFLRFYPLKDYNSREQVWVAACAIFFAVLVVAAGSAWGWSVARRSGEERPGRRLLLLVYGWLMVAGLPAWFPLVTLGPWILWRTWCVGVTADMADKLRLLLILTTIPLLSLPGLLVELRLRRKQRAAQGSPGH